MAARLVAISSRGGAGNDWLYGDVDITGGANAFTGNDVIHGDDGNDYLWGGRGQDRLFGDAGDDTLYVTDSKSTMFGGTGADTFAFQERLLGPNAGSKIMDFDAFEGDTIDLSRFDNDAATPFTFIGDADFSGTAGELQVKTIGRWQYVEVDLDGDGLGDLGLKVFDTATLTVDDFVL